MRVTKQRGFTIIETMLFLAVSGLLTIGILVSAGAAIGAQRYKDAVATLQSDIQQQYEDALSIKNSRDGAGTVSGCAGNRGQTECILMGKLMIILSNGTVTQYAVYGNAPPPATHANPVAEYDAIKSYNPQVVMSSAQEGSMEWGTGIAWPSSGTSGPWPIAPRNLGVLVVRSPQSGSVYTFTRNSDQTTDINSFIDDTARQQQIICVSTTGWLTGDRMSVVIAERAASANAVNVQTNQMTKPRVEC